MNNTNEMNHDDFLKQFNEEELALLEKLYQKQQELSIEQFDTLKNQSEDYAESQYKPLMNRDSCLDSPVELMFVINCIVLNKNDSGEVISHDEILNKHYHVPLLNKDQVKEYVDGFFHKFQNSATQQAQETLGDISDE